MNEKVFLATFEQRLKDESIKKCFSDIRNSDRCRLYKEIKTVFECESYMSCNIRRDVRVCFTKLRLNSHKFLVERAGWINPIRSGLFQTVNDPGGGLYTPPPTISKTLLSIFTISYM